MRYIGSIVFLGVLALIIIVAVQFKDSSVYQLYRNNAENFIQYIGQWIKVKKHNFNFTFGSFLSAEEGQSGSQEAIVARRPPESLLVARTKLENFLPEKFVKELTPQDWNYIFGLIYEPVVEKQGDFDVKRYLSRQEIEQELIYRFKFPFSFFRKQHWDHFWSIVLR